MGAWAGWQVSGQCGSRWGEQKGFFVLVPDTHFPENP